MSTIKLQPGFLVSLSTKVEGGLTYDRNPLEDEILSDGSELKKWETTKIIADPEEHAEAGKVRQQARNMIATVCIHSPFGLICPSGEIGQLDLKIAEARDLIAAFNDDSQHTRIRLATIRGEIAENKAEAVAAVREEVSSLMADMDRAVQLGEVKTIRDIAGRATQMGHLLDQQSSGRDALSRAVNAARRVARQIVKRVESGAETVATVIEESNLSPIAEARFVFDGPSPEDVEDEPDDDPIDEMPAVDPGRFSGLGLSPEIDTEPAEAPELPFANRYGNDIDWGDNDS